MIAKRKIPVESLREGMFVAELDRPWLETPFLFQGFLVRNQREIEEICRYCRWVWIDRRRSAAETFGPEDEGESGPDNDGIAGWLRRALDPGANEASPPAVAGLEGLGREAYDNNNEATMREELPRATESIRQAEQMVRNATMQLRVSDTIKLSLVENAVDPIIESVLRNKDAMIWLQSIRGKDEYTFSRSVACAVWGVIFGRHLGLDRRTLTKLAIGSLLLDLGKVAVPDELLTRNGPLADHEMELVRRHVEHGVEMLERGGEIDPAIIEMVRTHHERYNGTGYPHGLEGTAIPALGKIAGILDTFVAMTSTRPYADAMATFDVMRHLNDLADVEFQAELVEQFIQAVGMFPTGSLVELSTGEVAIVTEQNRIRRLRPTVMVVLDAEKQLLEEFRSRNLRECTTDETGKHSLWIRHGLPPGAYGIDPQEFFL